MSLLTLAQNISLGINIREPSSVVGSTNRQVRELLQIIRAVGDDLLLWPWPELMRQATITSVASQASYALPSDFNYPLVETFWKADEQEPFFGPLSAQEWQENENSTVASISEDYFRIKGIADNQFFISPTPDDAQDFVFEYASRSWIRPRTWAESQIYSAGAYTFYNGNYYLTAAGGSTGATAPTHTTGSASDGTVTWAYYDGAYEDFTADTDEVLLDAKLIELGAKAFWMRSKRLQYEDFLSDYETHKRTKMSRKNGSRPILLNGQRFTQPWPNVPQRIPY